jgi:hypothetical protein
VDIDLDLRLFGAVNARFPLLSQPLARLDADASVRGVLRVGAVRYRQRLARKLIGGFRPRTRNHIIAVILLNPLLKRPAPDPKLIANRADRLASLEHGKDHILWQFLKQLKVTAHLWSSSHVFSPFQRV